MPRTIMCLGRAIEITHATPTASPATETAASVLNALWLKGLINRLSWHFSKDPEDDVVWRQIAAKHQLSLRDGEPDELHEEAITIAEELIRKQLALDDLPPPSSLRDHAEALLDSAAGEGLVSKARLRVEAKHRIAQQSLAALGGASP